MQIHPQFNPVLLDLPGPLAVNWYGLSYLAAFLAAYLLATWRAKMRPDFGGEAVPDLVFYGALGVILGGRIGYVLLYQFGAFLDNPLYLFRAWEGGMSFHGGFLGVVVAMFFWARKYQKTAFQTLDFIAPCVPLGIGFGRLGNYINGELWGRVSDGGYAWLTGFPQASRFDAELIASDPAYYQLAELAQTKGGELMMLLPRHPSMLYEAFFEGLVLFVVLWVFSAKPRPRFAVSAVFLLGYGTARFCIEFFRQPDFDQGFVLLGWLTKGQLYSLPMIGFGLYLLWLAYHKNIYDWGRAATPNTYTKKETSA